MKPQNLNRHTPLSRDIWKVREQILAHLIDAYGLTGEGERALLYGLIRGLCEDHIPAYTHASERSGPKRHIQDPVSLYGVVNAIQSMVRAGDNAPTDPKLMTDPQLRALAGKIAREMIANRKRSGVASICERLRKEKNSPWYGQKRETLRDNYHAIKKRNEPFRLALKAAADAASAA